MAMTIEQEREAFEKWMSEAHPSYPLTSHEGRYVLTSVRNLWAAFSSGCAHITQPAQAVDVGAIREVIADMRDARLPPTPYLWCEQLTRALSAEKAGPVWDGWQPIETAPKDGNAVLVAFTADGERQVAEAYWSDDDDVWVCSRDGFMLHSRNEPTHFQPMPTLPASPTPGKEGA